MSVLIGAVGIAAVVAAGYVGRKGWLAFHRAVGISPGTLKYVEPSQLPPPPMLQLTLTEAQIDGLPPTPIALPSPASIEAAMHPADSDALYFVATGEADGSHKFTNTLTEHNRAVQDYLKVMRERRNSQ